MKRRQSFILALSVCSLALTVLLGSVIYYFVQKELPAEASSVTYEEVHGLLDDKGEMDLKKTSLSLRTGDLKDREVRGVWIASTANIDFPSKKGLTSSEQKIEIDNILKNVKETGLNTIFFQVRPSSDALYKSNIFPTSKFLTGRQGDKLVDDFDPFEYIIEKAHAQEIKVHAWVNPFRITTGSTTTLENDILDLSPTNPAIIHPEWTVRYADGKLYYNPGIPEVRQLFIDGIMEIVNNYDVDGIHLDDYFYPYPVNVTGADGKNSISEFNDSQTFAQYGGELTLADWRRGNIDSLIKSTYDSIKSVKADCEFGTSPFAIWANANDRVGGSETGGLQSYDKIYTDSKKWVENEWLDYVCPQIYWEFTHPTAPYDVIVKWWSSVVDGTKVKLYIGHALYKADSWTDKSEIARQIEFARSWHGYKGSILYGYSQIENNSNNMKNRLTETFYENYYHPEFKSTGESVTIGYPGAGASVKESRTFLLGASDPAYPVYYGNQKVPRTQLGYFSMYIPLESGVNNLKFTQNEKPTTITLYRNASENLPSGDKELNGMKITNISAKDDIIIEPGSEIPISLTAPYGSTVVAKIASESITLTPTPKGEGASKYSPQTYTGNIKLPSATQMGILEDIGNISFTATLGDETVSVLGSNVKLITEGYKGFVEVIKDNSYTKVSPTTDFYQDYLPSSIGMRDYIVSLSNGLYHLRFGGYISQKNVKLISGTLLSGKIVSTAMQNTEKITQIRIGITENVPLTASCRDGIFTLKLFNVSPEYTQNIDVVQNPLFSECKFSTDSKRQSVTYELTLKNADNYYGFNVIYNNSIIELNFNNPRKLPNSSTPLEGLTIVVDPGHGGRDSGALGFRSSGTSAINEKDLNLSTALVLRRELEKLGATVIMTRETDVEVALESRVIFLNDTLPDLSISVHHNAVSPGTDTTRVRGFLGLWWNESGRLLSKSISSTVAQAINRYERKPSVQELALCRNHKFPSTLLEMGFMTSPEEYDTMIRPENIELSGWAIAQGVLEYFKSQEKFL